MIPCVHDTLDSVAVAPAPLAFPVTLIGRQLGSEIPTDATGPGTVLAWQSSIGQFIFLESIEPGRI
jgi:hypothetical protein